MSSGIEHIQIDFHNKAQPLFFEAYESFLSASATINRNETEFQFQQLKQTHMRTFEQQLKLVAEELLQQYQGEKLLPELDLKLHHFMAEYLHRFNQRWMSISTAC